MENELDALLAETSAEPRGQPIAEARQVRIRDHADLHVSRPAHRA
jgi:hypothetical protein